MIRALVYGDLQSTEGPERCFADPALPLQRYRVDLFYRKLHQLYREHECNALWDLGDTTDDRTAIPLPALQSVSSGLKPFGRSPFNIKLIGNHEQYTRNTEIDNGCVFDSVFSVVRGNQVFEFEDVIVVACSFPASQNTAAEQISSLLLKHRRKPILVLGHLEILGTKVKSGITLDGMPMDVFSLAQVVLLGHIHLPQELKKGVYYVGSPFQQDFGEAGETKRVGLVTIKEDIIELDWITLGGFPEYRHVSYTEFVAKFDPDSEDRYDVKIQSPAEAELFYQHPYSARVQVEYDYKVMDTSLSGQTLLPKDWGLRAAAARWVAECDPATRGIVVPADELLDFGIQIAEGELVR